MRYLPLDTADRADMLAKIGVRSSTISLPMFRAASS